MPDGEMIRRITGLLVVALLVAGSFRVLWAFLPAMIWAATIVISTWPVLRWVEGRLAGRRGPAVAVLTTIILLTVLLPIIAAILALVDHGDDLTRIARAIAEAGIPAPPAWLAGIPIVGRRWNAAWAQLAAVPPEQLPEHLAPYARQAAEWLKTMIGGIFGVVVQLLLTAIICAILYGSGEKVAARFLAFARRLAGPQGEAMSVLAARSVRGVATGVVVTAIVQAVISGIALAVAGIPGAGLLTAIVFMCCLAQLGPILVLLAATGWLFWKGQTTAAIVFLVASLAIGTLDNFLRPVLIRKGADLPLLLVFAGVIGGILAFGILGIFIGPVLLAATKSLFDVWLEPAAAPSTAG